VAAGARNLQSSLGGLLSAHVFEVDGIVLCIAEKRIAIDLQRHDPIPGVYEMNNIHQRPDGINIDAADHRGFAGIDLGDNKALQLLTAGFDGDRQRSPYPADSAIER